MDGLYASAQLKQATGTGQNDLLRNVSLPKTDVMETLRKINPNYQSHDFIKSSSSDIPKGGVKVSTYNDITVEHVDNFTSSGEYMKVDRIDNVNTCHGTINIHANESTLVNHNHDHTNNYDYHSPTYNLQSITNQTVNKFTTPDIDWKGIGVNLVVSFATKVITALFDDIFNGGEETEVNPFMQLSIQLIELKDFIEKAFRIISNDIRSLQSQVDIINNSLNFLTNYVKNETKYIIEQASLHHNIQYNILQNVINLIKNMELEMGSSFTQLSYSKLNSMLFKYETYEAKYGIPVENSLLMDLCDLLEDIIINPPMVNITSQKSIVKFYKSNINDTEIFNDIFKVYIKIRTDMKRRRISYDKRKNYVY